MSNSGRSAQRGSAESPAGAASARTVWGSVMLAAAVSTAASAEPVVTVSGGSDISGQNYEWTITHEYEAPLVYVAIPHFRGDLFYGPAGWRTEVVNKNSLDFQPGTCIAETEEPSRGLVRGQAGTFRLRLNSAGAPEGEGDIVVRFADGVEARVTAAVPVKQTSPIEPYATPAALGGMFALYLLVRLVLRRRGSSTKG